MHRLPCISFLLFFLLLTAVSRSQEYAVTETGDTIVIFMDGTWTYADGSYADVFTMEFELDTIDGEFLKPEAASKAVVSDLGFFQVFFDPVKWKRIPPGELNDEAEMAFEGKSFDAYAVVISEEVEIGTANIFRIAVDNMAEFLGTEPRILASELRYVNGSELIRGVFSLELDGLKVTYQSYYFSSEMGTIQFTTWTGTNVYGKYSDEMEGLLNGLVIGR